MEDRLLTFLDMEQLSPSRFADIIGVQRSSVSHILAGRNKPSFDFLQKTLKKFPLLNADWLILGEGKMYSIEEEVGSGNLFNQQEEKSVETQTKKDATDKLSAEESADEADITDEKEILAKISPTVEGTEFSDAVSGGDKRKLVKILLLYSDKSFHAFHPGE